MDGITLFIYFRMAVLSILFPKNANRLMNLTSTSIRLAKLETQSNLSIQYGDHLQTELKMILMLRVFQFKKFNFRQIFKIKFQKCLPPSPYLHAEIVETTFVRSRFSDIRHGYDFVPSLIRPYFGNLKVVSTIFACTASFMNGSQVDERFLKV